MKLAGTHAIVTGGSQGIGLETARLLAGRGARVSLIARDPENLAAAQRSIGDAAATASADVTQPEALNAALAGLTNARGPCDLLVCSAGSAHPGYFEQLEIETFRSQMDLDYFGTLHAIRAVLPSMLERGRGGIVGVSSAAGLLGVFGFGAYAPTKYAVRGLCDVLRAEFEHRGIYVGCVFPPDTLTPGFETENLIKPAETAAVSATIKPMAAEAVAAAIVKGIEKGRHVITADRLTATLAYGGGLVAPLVHREMARQVRRATAS